MPDQRVRLIQKLGHGVDRTANCAGNRAHRHTFDQPVQHYDALMCGKFIRNVNLGMKPSFGEPKFQFDLVASSAALSDSGNTSSEFLSLRVRYAPRNRIDIKNTAPAPSAAINDTCTFPSKARNHSGLTQTQPINTANRRQDMVTVIIVVQKRYSLKSTNSSCKSATYSDTWSCNSTARPNSSMRSSTRSRRSRSPSTSFV